MSKRSYTHLKEIEGEILSLREAGMTRQEIADELGLKKSQIKDWVRRYNKRQLNLCRGIPSQRKGPPRRRPLTTEKEYQQEIARLQMENKLLRDFLQSTERLTIKSLDLG